MYQRLTRCEHLDMGFGRLMVEHGIDIAKLSEQYVVCLFGTTSRVNTPALACNLRRSPYLGICSKYLTSGLPRITILHSGIRL